MNCPKCGKRIKLACCGRTTKCPYCGWVNGVKSK